MEDAELINTAAAELVHHSGHDDALQFLYEQAEISAETGDRLSAATWLDIAGAVEILLPGRKCSTRAASP